uniref:Major facilitator superfamily (MFS) profile domain-containing protein n=1 Tax=Tetradesmus obliquus TaxID=3088 RepID=A0A383V931_TETOB|eukprot:jgi/Sobl393_1/9395/SZX61460.1
MADVAEDEGSFQKPRWFTPGRLLLIFCITNLVVYLDRGVIASNGVNGSPRTEQQPMGSGIQGEFDLSNTQDGFLATAFLVGLLLASPVFSESCKHYSAFRLIGIGMGTWALATFGCGLAVGFKSLIFCRMLVGVGEASFVALAAPFIDDYAPPAAKARWFATFYLCIPTGFAAGYIYGGLVSAALGWRAAFFIESAAILPFVVFAFVSRPLHLTGSRETGPDPDAPKSFKDVTTELALDASRVASHTVWLHMTAAYVMYTAVLGVYAFWGPKAGKRIYQLQGESADVVFGGVTVITGVFGSLFGGLALDALGSTLSNANLVCGVSNLVGLVFVLASFLAAKSFTAFIVLFALGELALFMMQAPVNAIGMWSVPPALRPLAISMVTVSIHLLGDVPSPPLVGAIQSALEAGKAPAEADAQWRISMSLISLLLAFSGATFLRGSFVSRRAKDYRKVDELAAATAAAEHHHMHLPQHTAAGADADDGSSGLLGSRVSSLPGSPSRPGHRRRGSSGSLLQNSAAAGSSGSLNGGGGSGGATAAGGGGIGGWLPTAADVAAAAGDDKQPLLDPEDPGSSSSSPPQRHRD